VPFFVRKEEAAMKNLSAYDYYYGGEAEQYSFYRIPKTLFTDVNFKSLSCEAKVLYGLMLDRLSLSMKNGWVDGQNRVYIYFTLEDVQACMCCGHDKGVKLLAELDSDKGIGLIRRVKQGLGKPTKIYVKNFVRRKAEVLTSEKPKSGLPEKPNPGLPEKPNPGLLKSRSQEFGSPEANNTNLSQTDLNEPEYQSIYPDESKFHGNRDCFDRMDMIEHNQKNIKENLDYDILCSKYDKERIDEIMELLSETVSSTKKVFRIGGQEIPADVVKSRLLKLNSSHIEYVFDCMDKNTTEIRNIKSYLLTALFNAPITISHYYQAEVNHDLYGDKS
jgi:hypothetical protein